MPIKSVIYARVSTEEQGKGYSLPTQLEACRNYAQSKGYEGAGEFTDMHTGTELDRPGLNKLYDCINLESAKFLIVYDIDRLSREVSLQAIIEMEMARLGVKINYVIGDYEETPEGELLKLVKSGIAQYENRNRVERCRRGRLGKARAGYVVCPSGRAPFGYNYVKDGHKSWFEINDEQAKVVKQIYSWLVDGRFSSYAIAKKLWENGILSKGDYSCIVYKKFGHAEWSPSTVRRIISSPVYKGIWHYNKTRRNKINGKYVSTKVPENEWIPVNVPAIIDDWLWKKAQDCLESNRHNSHRNTKKKYLLRGLIFCPCGRRWTAVYKSHLQRAYYRCPTNEAEHWRKRCPNNFSIRQEILEEVVWNNVKELFSNIEKLKLFLDKQWSLYMHNLELNNSRSEEILKSIVSVDKKLGFLLDQLLKEEFTSTVVEPRQKLLTSQRLDLDRELRRVRSEMEQPIISPEKANLIIEFAKNISPRLNEMDFDEKRGILEKLELKISVIDKGQINFQGSINDVLIMATISTGNWPERSANPEPG
jgi:site-specific DNA recombinase